MFSFTTEGKIEVYIEYTESEEIKLLATAQDKKVLKVKYFGFASYDNSLAKFFYNCEGDNAYSDEDLKTLCAEDEALENEYLRFHKITDVSGIRQEGYIINFPFYIQAERDAHVLLTEKPEANREANEYEIRKYSIVFFLFFINNNFFFVLFYLTFSLQEKKNNTKYFHFVVNLFSKNICNQIH